MAIERNQNLTFFEWMAEIARPKKKYYRVCGDDHMRTSEEDFQRQERIYVGRKEKSAPHIVLCPESNCKILIQTYGGVRGAKLSATWKKGEAFKQWMVRK